MSIGNNIKKFRLSKALSLQQLADLVSLSKASIQQYEDGTTQPSNKALLSIAQALKVNLWSFFETVEVTLELAEFRHGEKLTDSESEKKRIHDEVISRSQGFMELENLLNAGINFDNPLADLLVRSVEDGESAAKQLRKKWKLQNLPIDSICGLLEDQGFKILTVERQTDSPGICGFIREHEQMIPFIILNILHEHVRETTRKRFTIAHECAHLLLRMDDSVTKDLAEKICNRFASAFLLPATALIDFLGSQRISISLAELRELKEVYGLSIMSIIYRASEIGLINYDTCREWIEHYNGWRIAQEDFGIFTKSKEEPTRLNRLVNRALSEQRISREMVAQLMHVPLDQINDKFGNQKLNLI
ncbi:helix-turn-helix domain-containing protein [Mucilaginibacter segetis]|uniref:ImmA/IrrE family metallo-endopeptidase n=1 Tax=Mucilaginibacter segetis TaxID=2793071 RepID=A0A934UMS5_9SPHI|nr:XRE family transcriptional regulator [Mucilaginibacter segetis]MBK0379330.1 ImmA/IrrE family metallo-endopeptidase [Mucilaginibacter segetis]